MKNTATLVSVILLFFLVMVPISKADVTVSPTELYLTMTDTYIEGNTTKKITVTNHYSHDISVKVWMMHPDITEWMRPNRTFIENISWITIEPSELSVPSDTSANFYIYLTIPNETKNQTYYEHWETWAALKIVNASLKEGYLVRVYIDTPKPPTEPSGTLFPIFYVTSIAAIAVVLITITLYFYIEKRRKNKNI
jgi:P pilus assembly chaperone PapD